MLVQGFLNLTALNFDISLGSGSAAVLKKHSDKLDIVIAVHIDRCGKELPEGVRADTSRDEAFIGVKTLKSLYSYGFAGFQKRKI